MWKKKKKKSKIAHVKVVKIKRPSLSNVKDYLGNSNNKNTSSNQKEDNYYSRLDYNYRRPSGGSHVELVGQFGIGRKSNNNNNNKWSKRRGSSHHGLLLLVDYLASVEIFGGGGSGGDNYNFKLINNNNDYGRGRVRGGSFCRLVKQPEMQSISSFLTVNNGKKIKIGNYFLGKTIGKGNSAVVKVAVHGLTKQLVTNISIIIIILVVVVVNLINKLI